jgi:hypothetical protein
MRLEGAGPTRLLREGEPKGDVDFLSISLSISLSGCLCMYVCMHVSIYLSVNVYIYNTIYDLCKRVSRKRPMLFM